MFHVWGAYLCLAAAVGRRVWFVADDGYLQPHLYVLYVGKAGNGKGEAMRKVKRVLAELGDVHLSGNVETPEGFIRYLCGNPNAKPPVVSPVRKLITGPTGHLEETTPITIFATEFINFIAMNPAGWINLLNDIWDADPNYHYRTKNMGEDLVPGPSINIIGALTTDMAANLQKQQIIGTGLGRRTLFQWGERQWDNPIPRRVMTPERVQAFENAVRILRSVRQLTGLMTNESAADEYYDDWYNQNLRNTPTRALQIQSWYASKADVVIKLAMLTAISEGEVVVRIPHYEVALAYLDLLEQDLPRIFGGVGRNELADVALTIYEYLTLQKEPISQSRLKSQFFTLCKPPNEFNDCIEHLIGTGKVKRDFLGVGDKGDTIIGTHQVMQEFVLAHPTIVRPDSLAQPSKPSDSSPSVGPPSEPPEGHA